MLVWILSIRSAHIALIGFVWHSTMFPNSLVAGAIPVRWSMLFLATAIMLHFGRLRSRLPARSPLFVVLMLWWAWTAATTIGATFRPDAFATFMDFSATIISVLLVAMHANSRRRIEAIIMTVAISFGYFGVKGGSWVLITAGGGTVLGPPGTYLAAENEVARALVVAIPLMAYLYWNASNRLIRLSAATACILSIVGVLGTGSRGGFLAMVVTLLVLGCLKLSAKTIFRMLCAVGLVGSLLYFGLSEDRAMQISSRLNTIEDYGEDNSFNSRSRSWQFAIEIAQRSPIIGGGFEIFRSNTIRRDGSWQAAHSNYFQVLAEHGFVGLALYVALISSALFSLYCILLYSRGRSDARWCYDLCAVLASIICGYVVGGIVINQAYFFPFYLTLGLAIAADGIWRSSLPTHANRIGVSSADKPLTVEGSGHA